MSNKGHNTMSMTKIKRTNNNLQNITQKTKYRATGSPPKPEIKLVYSWRVSCFWSTCHIRRVALVCWKDGIDIYVIWICGKLSTAIDLSIYFSSFRYAHNLLAQRKIVVSLCTLVLVDTCFGFRIQSISLLCSIWIVDTWFWKWNDYLSCLMDILPGHNWPVVILIDLTVTWYICMCDTWSSVSFEI
jgi:hypothetical protein